MLPRIRNRAKSENPVGYIETSRVQRGLKMKGSEVDRLDFIRETTHIILAEVDVYQAFVILQVISQHSIIFVLISDVEDVFAG